MKEDLEPLLKFPYGTPMSCKLGKSLFLMSSHFLYSLFLSVILFSPSLADHGISTWGNLKYGKDFMHFEYVNPKAPQGGTVTHGALGSFDSLNHYIVKGLPAAGLALLHATLLAPANDEVNTGYAYLAEDVSIDKDKLTVTFTLHQNATFSDGSPITAEDIVFSFNILKKEGLPLFRTYYQDVEAVTAEGKYKVVFKLRTMKNKELPVILGQIPAFSKVFYQKHKFSDTTLTPPPSSGPYKVAAVDPGRSVTYEKIPNWWGDHIPSQKGIHNFKTVRYLYFRDLNAMFESFKAGDVDVRIEASAQRWNTGYDFEAVKNGSVKKESIAHKMCAGSYGIFFNTRRDVFKNRDVRRALTLLFDFEFANNHLFYKNYKRNLSYFPNAPFSAEGEMTQKEAEILKESGLKDIPESMKTSFTLPVIQNEQDRRKIAETALHILKNQGYTLKNQKLIGKNGKPLSFEFLIYDKTFERVLANFAQALKNIGIDARIRFVDTTTYQSRMDDTDFDLAFLVIPISNSPGNELRDYFGSKSVSQKGTRNYAGIQDPIIDALIEKLIITKDYEELKVIMKAMDRRLLDGYYMVPAWHSDKANIAYWDKFGRPSISAPYAPADFDTWWRKTEEASPPKDLTHVKTTESPSTGREVTPSLSLWDRLKNWLKELFY